MPQVPVFVLAQVEFLFHLKYYRGLQQFDRPIPVDDNQFETLEFHRNSHRHRLMLNEQRAFVF
jgi:hypothetical protein